MAQNKQQVFINDILAKYKLTLERLEWALNELEKKPKETIVNRDVETIREVIIEKDPQETKAQFGTAFPTYDIWKGDLYRRVDQIPHITFKWNGVMWMEIDNAKTDRYANTPEYIRYVGEKIMSAQYDIDFLNPVEQDAVMKKYNNQVKNMINKSKGL
jgi:hypothetical protein